jgi:hypothetical protein
MLWLGLVVALGATENGVTLVRTYKNASLVEISADGQLILTRLNQEKVTDCPDHMQYCLADVLAVHEAGTGRSVGKLVAKGRGNFGLAGFLRGNTVLAIEYDWKSLPPARVTWNLVSGVRSRIELAVQKGAMLLCPVDESRILSGMIDGTIAPQSYQLQVLGATGSMQSLKEPKLPFVRNGGTVPGMLESNCTTWRSQDSYLMEGAEGNEGLYWVSTRPDAPARFCYAFPEERIRDYAISPDGSMIGVATNRRETPSEAGKLHDEFPLFLTLLNAADCSTLRRVELQFPEKPKLKSFLIGGIKYYDNRHFWTQFPAGMAISPDKTKLAIAYGVYRKPSGYAYFGLYSLADERRLATLNGDVEHKWLWSGFLNDEIFAQGAPIGGALQFAPDSRTLYGTSEHLRQWDISGLR